MMFPAWTKEKDRALNIGRDYLGIQNVGNSIMNALLPGLTGATIHPRHYSYFCWAVRQSKDWGAAKNHKEQLDFLYRYENIILYASELHTHRYALNGARPGANSVRRILKARGNTLPLNESQVERNPSIFDEVNYGPSMKELRLLSQSADQRFLQPSEERGRFLAEQYEASIKPVIGLLAGFAKAQTISRRDAAKLGYYVCPCSLSRSPAEMKALRDLLFADIAKPLAEDIQRRKSLLTILTLARALPGSPDPEWDFPVGIYYLHLGKKALVPPAALEGTFHSWALYQARVFIQHALTGIWTSLLWELAAAWRKEMDVSRVVAVWMSHASDSRILSEMIPKLSRQDPTISELLHAIQPKASESGFTNLIGVIRAGPARSEILSEQRLAERLDTEYFAERPYALAIASTLLLLSTLQKWNRVDDSEWDFDWTLTAGGHQRLSMRSLAQDVQERKSLRLSQFLAFALRKYVVDQHFFFASEKLLSGRNTFHFERGNSGIRLLEEDEGGWDGANYVRASLRLMQALHLLDRDEDKNTFRVTKPGEAFLSGVLKD